MERTEPRVASRVLRKVRGVAYSQSNWLGRRDSNPDTQIQSLQSYR
jgi:hypothetical protein